ncbi:MAG: hypothetical protein VW405_01445 [Rhodospirillaceae bacterium]
MADAKIFRPSRHISQKVPKRGGPSPAQAIMRALNAAEDLMGEYQGWAVDDLEALWQSFIHAAAADVLDADEIQNMFNMAHEIRGQGGTFGFPLVTVIADSLCKFIDGRARLTAVELEVIKVHILGMKAVFRQRLEGDHEELATELRSLLELLRAKVDMDTNFGVGGPPAGG